MVCLPADSPREPGPPCRHTHPRPTHHRQRATQTESEGRQASGQPEWWVDSPTLPLLGLLRASCLWVVLSPVPRAAGTARSSCRGRCRGTRGGSAAPGGPLTSHPPPHPTSISIHPRTSQSVSPPLSVPCSSCKCLPACPTSLSGLSGDGWRSDAHGPELLRQLRHAPTARRRGRGRRAAQRRRRCIIGRERESSTGVSGLGREAGRQAGREGLTARRTDLW